MSAGVSPDARLEPPASVRYDISPGREMRIYALIGLILAGYVAAIVTARELFPFSTFPMFSASFSDQSEFTRLRWMGFAGDQEFEFDKLMIRAMVFTKKNPLERLLKRRERVPGGGRAILATMLEYHDRWRVKTGQDVPRLDGIRVYQDGWDLEAREPDPDRPDRRKLVVEMHRGAE